MKNPLNKRLKREILNNLGKYISIFLLLTLTIALTSSFFLVQKSVKFTYDNSHESGNVEDGQIEFVNKLSKNDEKIFENNNVEIEENYYINIKKDNNKLFRIYVNREKINTVGIYEGRLPSEDNEILVERLYAKNNDLSIGSELKISNKIYTVTAIAAFPDYSSLLRKSSDYIMDNNDFCLCTLTEEAFDELSKKENVNYLYSYTLNDKNLDLKAQTEKLTDISKEFSDKEIYPINASIKSTNKNISYFADDMGGDVPMVIIFFSLMLIIMAFIFIVIIHSTIEEESRVIGTLLASGYTKGHILRHYIMLPLIVTIFSIIAGNIAAYTFFKNIMLDLYIESYSLFPVILKSDTYALIITAILPLILILSINSIYTRIKLKNKPLDFLRKDLNKKTLKNAIKLPNITFLSKYRMRVFLRNKGGFLILLLGILLGNMLLIFGLNFRPLLEGYTNDIEHNMPSNYQIVLKGPLQEEIIKRNGEAIKKNNDTIIDNPTNELQTDLISDIVDNKDINLFSISSLESDQPIISNKIDIQLYGTDLNGKFFKGMQSSDMKEDTNKQVYATEGLLKKLKLEVGDDITLYNKFKGEKYRLKITGKTERFASSLALLMNRKDLNELLDKDSSYYNGIFSDKKIKLEDKFISAKINRDDMKNLGEQFIKIIGNIAYIILVISIILYFVVIYVLTKSIIEKYNREIAYLRIFGYTDREINNVYVKVSTIFVIIAGILLIPLEHHLTKKLFELSLLKLNAYININIPYEILIYTFLALIATYTLVRFFLLSKIKRIEMSEALKDVV